MLPASFARAGEAASSAMLAWRSAGKSAVTRPPALLVQSTPAQSPETRPNRNVLQWSPSRMSYRPPRDSRRDAILRVSGQEPFEAPNPEASPASDADAHKNPFEVARRPDGGRAAPVHELPVPEKTATDVQGAGELPIPDSVPPAADPLGELPIPEDSGPRAEAASQPPDATKSPGEPAPLTPDEEELKQPSPDLPDRQFELPSDDLSQGLGAAPRSGDCRAINYADECRKALRELQQRDITSVVVGVIIEGAEGTDFPCDCVLGRDFEAPRYTPRNFSPTLFTWKASGLCHKPLYFEDVQLERYGHSWNPILQPFVSGAHFFVSVPLLPYKMGLTPPHECVYTLGYYRPGSCAPYMFEPIPLSVRAALWEAAGATAFAFWFWPPN